MQPGESEPIVPADESEKPAPETGAIGTAEPEIPAQRVFDRIEPVFTTPPDGLSLGDATTFADAPAILPALRTPPPAQPAPAQAASQPPAAGEGPTRAVLPPPGFNAPPPGYPGAPGYPSYHGTAAVTPAPGTPAAPPPGYPQAGYPQPGHPQPGYSQQPGFQQPGYPQQPGFQQPGYPPPGYGQPGYGQPGQPPQGFGQPGYPPPGYAGMPPGPPPVPAAPRKKRTGRNIVIAVISAAVLLGMPGVAVALTAPPSASKPITLPKLPEPVDTTKVGDATRDRATVMSRGLVRVLADQEKAMADRDEATFLKAVATPAATAALSLRFRNLSAMKVAEFHLSAAFPESAGAALWKSTLAIEYCFGQSGCSRDTVREAAVWRDTADGPKLVSLGVQPVGEDWFQQPQPWEQTPLIAAVGVRVVVAMPASLKSRLTTVLREAEKAAVVADSFAVGTKPDFYRVYLANKTEWRTWFGNKPSKWVAGYTTATGPNHGDVVINTAEAPNSYLPTMLRHEMTHAASTYGQHYSRDLWWEIEGYAQLAEPAMQPGLRAFIRSYIHSTWNGRLPLDAPSASASPTSVAGLYGVGFAAMSYLQKKYGRAAVVDFFNKTVRNGLSLESSSQEVFKASWSTVQSGIVKGVRGF